MNTDDGGAPALPPSASPASGSATVEVLHSEPSGEVAEPVAVRSPRRQVASCDHPSAVVFATIVLCPRGEECATRDAIGAALKELPFDQATAYVSCRAEEHSPWGPPRLYVPHRIAVIGSSKPLFPLRALLALTSHSVWLPLFALCVILGLFLTAGVSRINEGEYYWWASPLGMSLILAALVTNLSMYSRTIMRELLRSFEFWFLTVQCLIITSTTAYYDYRTWGDVETIPLRVLTDLSTCFAIFGMDASAASRQRKGVIAGITAAGLTAWMYLWSSDTSPAATYILDLWFAHLTVRGLAVNACVTVAAFCVRYCIAALLMKHDAMIVKFAPRLVRLEHAHFVDEGEGTPNESMPARTNYGNGADPDEQAHLVTRGTSQFYESFSGSSVDSRPRSPSTPLQFGKNWRISRHYQLQRRNSELIRADSIITPGHPPSSLPPRCSAPPTFSSR